MDDSELETVIEIKEIILKFYSIHTSQPVQNSEPTKNTFIFSSDCPKT